MKTILLLFAILFSTTICAQNFSFSPPHLLNKVHDYKLVKSNIEFTYNYKLNKTFKLEVKYINSYLTNKYKFQINTQNKLYSYKSLTLLNTTAIEYDMKKLTYPIGFKLSYKTPWKGVKISADVNVTNLVVKQPYYLNIKTTYQL